MNKKIFMVFFAICLLIPTFLFANVSNTDRVIDKNVFCATGNPTAKSIEILAVDEEADYLLLYIDEKVEKLLTPNEFGWTLTKLEGLEKGKEYECYVISYRNGEKFYSKTNSFIFGEENNN